MRLWVGNEKEGANIGVKTLFVESDRLTLADLMIVKREAKKHDTNRIYFGAGRKDVLHLNTMWAQELKGFSVVVETTGLNISQLPNIGSFNEVILRVDIFKAIGLENVIPKIDNGEKVVLFYEGISTSLENLENGIYVGEDTIINI